MSLLAAANAKEDDLYYLVDSVDVVKVYYVWAGRNAWWSTWSTRYSPGCFHRTLQSAKAFCESRRVQGTVFYIDELPSLSFHASGRTLVVSEINTDQFLAKFDFKRLTSISTALPVSTMTLQQFWYLFRIESTLWPPEYPRRNSAFVTFDQSGEPFERIEKSQELSSYSSSSRGPDYYLGWNRRPFTKNRALTHAICDALKSRLDKP